MTTTERAFSYTDAMPAAIAGEGGHAATFRVALAAAQGFALDEEGTIAVLERYNERCVPPWREADLRHKARSAIASPSQRPAGYLLGDGIVQPFTPSPVRTKPKVAPDKPLPCLARGSDRGIDKVSALLGIDREAVELARDAGIVRFGYHSGEPAWFVSDRSRLVCQARRLDGEAWGHRGKAHTFVTAPGSGRHLVGLPLIGNSPAAILCEGGTDLVSAFAILICQPFELFLHCPPLAMLGAGARLLADEARTLEGRKIFLVYDSDRAGQEGLQKRAEELAAIGAEPFRLDLPPGCGDLRDSVRAGHAVEIARHIASEIRGEGQE